MCHLSETHFFTGFRLSWWLIIDVNSVLGLLQCVVVDDVANVSDVQAVSKMLATSPRITLCNNPKRELTAYIYLLSTQ
jgi:hypothetical protein